MSVTRAGVWPFRRYDVRDSRFPGIATRFGDPAKARGLALTLADGDASLIDFIPPVETVSSGRPQPATRARGAS